MTEAELVLRNAMAAGLMRRAGAIRPHNIEVATALELQADLCLRDAVTEVMQTGVPGGADQIEQPEVTA